MPTQETINFLVYFHLATLAIGGIFLICIGAYLCSRADEKKRKLENWKARDKFDLEHTQYSEVEKYNLMVYISKLEDIKKTLFYYRAIYFLCFLVGGFFLLLLSAEIWLALFQALVNIVRATKQHGRESFDDDQVRKFSSPIKMHKSIKKSHKNILIFSKNYDNIQEVRYIVQLYLD